MIFCFKFDLKIHIAFKKKLNEFLKIEDLFQNAPLSDNGLNFDYKSFAHILKHGEKEN